MSGCGSDSGGEAADSTSPSWPDGGSEQDWACEGDPCRCGEGAGLFFVKIVASADDSGRFQEGSTAGPDIDALGLYRADAVVVWADEATYFRADASACGNDYCPAPEILGEPDASSIGPNLASFSLGSGSVVLSFDNDEELVCCDEIFVCEVTIEQNETVECEKYSVFMGEGTDCMKGENSSDCRWFMLAENICGQKWMQVAY